MRKFTKTTTLLCSFYALLSNTEKRISIDSIFGPGVTTEHSAIDLYGNGVRAYAARLPLNLRGRRTA